jgi:5-methylcytosine-specific restriction enzyme B
MFSWKPLYAEIAAELPHFSGESEKLVDLMVRMHEQGLKVSSVTDKDDGDVEVPLEEVDPFSFFANFNRGTTDVNRRAILSAIKEEWKLQSPLPEDFDGLPLMSSQNSWFMPFKKLRDAEHVETLWRFYLHCLKLDSAEHLDTAQFDACCSLRRVAPASLTMGMFWSRPDLWIAVDRKNRDYAALMGIDRTINSGKDYLRWLNEVRQKSDFSTCEFSLQGPSPLPGRAGHSRR